MAETFCPECGGIMIYDGSSRRYACRSCGLYVTKDEITELRERRRDEVSGDKKKRQEQSEYLDWWLSKKKKQV
jgi:DNA-directed RNA polymerase subunit M/transcription elongation factor TFIIS